MTFLRRSTYLRHARQFSHNARLFLLSQAVAGIGSGVYSLLFNLYLVRLGFREDFIGQVTGVTTLATGLVAIPAGLIADRIGRRRSMLIGGFVVPLGYLAQTLFPQPSVILFTGVIVGAGLAMISISFSPFMAENSTSEQRPYLFSLSFALMTLSGMLGNLAGGILPRLFAGAFSLLPTESEPYRLALWTAVLLFAIACAPFYLLDEDRRLDAHEEAPHPDVSMADAAVYRRIVAFVVANILVGIAGGLFLPFFNVFFKTFGLADEQVGLIFAVSQALMGIGMLLSPLFVRRFGKVVLIAAGHFWTLPFMLILAAVTNPWVAAAAFWGRNVGMNMINPAYGAFAMEMVPARLRATLSGINNTAWNVTWAISSIVGGKLILTLGYSKVFLIAAFFYAVTGTVFWLAFRRYRQT